MACRRSPSRRTGPTASRSARARARWPGGRSRRPGPAARPGASVPSRSTSSSTCAWGGTGRSSSEASQRWACSMATVRAESRPSRRSLCTVSGFVASTGRTPRARPSLNATWSGGRSVTPGSPTDATSSSSSSSTSAPAAATARAGWARTSCGRRRRTCAPQRAVRKSSSAVASRGLPTRTTTRLLGRSPQPTQPGLVGHPGAGPAQPHPRPAVRRPDHGPDRGHRGRPVGVEAEEDDAATPGLVDGVEPDVGLEEGAEVGDRRTASEAHADHPERHQPDVGAPLEDVRPRPRRQQVRHPLRARPPSAGRSGRARPGSR